MDSDLKYYPHLDSLRAFACLFVIIFHSNTVAFLRSKYHFNLFQGGYIGVDLFFTLSGFLITGILIDQFITADKVDVLTFYKKRLLRLYPPLIVATLVFLVPLLFWDHVAATFQSLFYINIYRRLRYFIPQDISRSTISIYVFSLLVFGDRGAVLFCLPVVIYDHHDVCKKT
ncbi:acyltransferase family protein [Pedobacter borealis]|uniref:acyltransferase family protein n=1 Tax=Pedobacter borealis TaxID=475254 RepID=UPI0004933A13|nr:acyltransferase [Pedobacter borealis]